jgi:predicted nucleic acid-binding Zn ribbon protein
MDEQTHTLNSVAGSGQVVPTEGDHRHCKVCGRVCTPGEETCSRTCAAEREQRMRTRRNYQLMLYIAVALVLIAFVSDVLR